MLQTLPTRTKPDELLAPLTDARVFVAKECFATFLRTIPPNMVWGWWVELSAIELQKFYDLNERAGLGLSSRSWRRRSTASRGPPPISSPGCPGKNPEPENDLCFVLARTLGERTNQRACSASCAMPNYRLVFPSARIDEPGLGVQHAS